MVLCLHEGQEDFIVCCYRLIIVLFEGQLRAVGFMVDRSRCFEYTWCKLICGQNHPFAEYDTWIYAVFGERKSSLH